MTSLPIRSPSVLTPGQRFLLARASNAFDLAEECPSAVCRRAGRCRGFEAGGSARCLSPMLHVLLTCTRLTRALLPGVGADEPETTPREPSLADEMREQMERMHRRVLALVKQEIDQLEGELPPSPEWDNKLM